MVICEDLLSVAGPSYVMLDETVPTQNLGNYTLLFNSTATQCAITNHFIQIEAGGVFSNYTGTAVVLNPLTGNIEVDTA